MSFLQPENCFCGIHQVEGEVLSIQSGAVLGYDRDNTAPGGGAYEAMKRDKCKPQNPLIPVYSYAFLGGRRRYLRQSVILIVV